MFFGIDISDAQRGLSVKALKAANPDLGWVAIKSTGSGGNYVNPLCDAWMQECFEIGLPVLNYDFTKDGTQPPSSGSAYADAAASHIEGYADKAGFAFDWEDSTAPGVGTSAFLKNTQYLADAVTAMKAHRSSPGVYVGGAELNSSDYSPLQATNAWLWIANYPAGYQQINGFGEMPDPSWVYKHPDWWQPAIWQFTSCLRLNGWDGNLDGNVFFGDRDGFLRLLGVSAGDPVPAPAPQPVPAPAPAPVAPPATSGIAGRCIVSAGDTLSSIGAQVGVSWQSIAAVNPGIDPNVIQVGQLINLPTGANLAALGSDGTPQLHSCTVDPGDTMSSIAAKFGVGLNALIAANPQISDPNTIYPGQTVYLP